MEWLLWLVGVPVALLLLLWAASKFSFPERPSGTNGSSGFFDALNDVYSPSSSAARIERDEQKRRIFESSQGQDRDPLAGFHPINPSDPDDGSDGGSDDTPSGNHRTPR